MEMRVTTARVPTPACVLGEPPTVRRVIINTPTMLMIKRVMMM